jgi:hypothetical protein
MLGLTRSSISRPAECPACRGDVFVPMLRAYRYAGARRERAGDVAQCAACGCAVTLLRDGRVLRAAGAASAAPARADRAPGAAPGGTGRSGPGWLDPDMTDPTHDGGGL